MIKNTSPLQWPAGWKRCLSPTSSPFGKKRVGGYGMENRSIGESTSFMVAEVTRLVGRELSDQIIISTNLKYRKDGLPYSDQAQPKDQGVAVYFSMKIQGKIQQTVMACDQYRLIQDNIYAIAKTIEAMRGIERWGSSDIMNRAFTGFLALPAPAQKNWWEVLYCRPDSPADLVKGYYRQMAKKYHPDNPNTGNKAIFNEVQFAWESCPHYQK